MRKGSYSEELVKIGIDFRIRSPSSRRKSIRCRTTWDSKELNIPGCVSIADSHEHTAGEVPHPISSRAVGRPTGGRWPSCLGRGRVSHLSW